MEEIGTDERKPFENEDTIKDEEETQPEPDEHLMMDQGNGRVWSVKVPKHLMEAWSMVENDDVQLATIRVYNKDPHTGKQRIVMLVPSDPAMSSADAKEADMDEYEMDMVNEAVDNQIVVAEREKTPGSRARMTILTGRIKHDCNLRPVFTEKYRQRMRERTIKANTPARTIRMIDEVAGGRGAVNILNSGMGPSTSTFSGLTKGKPKTGKGIERFTRMPRNQLLDVLFALYREKPRWSAKDLRARTEQPESYLKEVLSEIAELHRSGEFNGLYELKPNFKDTVKTESGDYTGAAAALMQKPEPVDVDMYDDDDDEDDDDDDDDMEEIS